MPLTATARTVLDRAEAMGSLLWIELCSASSTTVDSNLLRGTTA